MSAWSHHGSFDGSSTGSTSRRRSRESAMPITMATASVNAAPLANRSASGTAAYRRKDGMSAGARDPARSAVIARKRPAPATRAAPGIRLRVIGGGPERTPAPGLFANRLPRSPSCMLSVADLLEPHSEEANVTDVPRISGVLSPVVTPFGSDLAPDADRFVRQCRWLLSQNVGLAVFGTNSEANSLSVEEKIELLDRLVAAGVDPARMMPGTGCCALTDSVRLTKHAVTLGCAGVLMLPPFYYKGVSDDGLFRSFAEVVERVGDSALRIYLYHIPPVSNVPITLTLIERLLKAYPGTIAGAKDSGGDWSHTKAMLDQFAKAGFDVFPGAETFLLAGMRGGGAGCISATTNTNPAAIARLYATWRDADADAQQKRLDEIRGTFAKYPMIPALKAAIAHWSGDAEWATVRPPLVALTSEQRASLVGDLNARGFDMPGLAR